MPEILNREFLRLSVDDVVPNPANPNRGDLPAVLASIDALGFYGAILVESEPDADGRYRIVAGEHRWLAAVESGATTIPALTLDASDSLAELILLGDNQFARSAAPDKDALRSALAGILERSPSAVAGLGFRSSDLARLFGAPGALSTLDGPIDLPSPADEDVASPDTPRMVVVTLSRADAEELEVLAGRLGPRYKTRNLSDTVLRALAATAAS